MVFHRPEVFARRLASDSKTRIDIIGAWAAMRTYQDRMVNIGISGDPGMGKSTLAIEIGARVDKDFDLETHVAYTRREIIEKAYKLPAHSYIIVDEAIGAHKRRAMEGVQKDLIEMINKIRFKNHIMVWNLPIFTQLDRDLRALFDIWIHVPERGKAALFRKNLNILADDPWIPPAWRMRWENKSIRTIEGQWRMLRSHPLYEMTVHFPPLPPRVQRIYDLLSHEAKAKLEREDNAKKLFLRQLGTTTPMMTKAYVTSTIVLGHLIRSGDIGVSHIRRALAESPLKEEVKEVVGGLLNKKSWWPPDANNYARWILKKYESYLEE